MVGTSLDLTVMKPLISCLHKGTRSTNNNQIMICVIASLYLGCPNGNSHNTIVIV